jgi:hypothetical protein
MTVRGPEQTTTYVQTLQDQMALVLLDRSFSVGDERLVGGPLGFVAPSTPTFVPMDAPGWSLNFSAREAGADGSYPFEASLRPAEPCPES